MPWRLDGTRLHFRRCLDGNFVSQCFRTRIRMRHALCRHHQHTCSGTSQAQIMKLSRARVCWRFDQLKVGAPKHPTTSVSFSLLSISEHSCTRRMKRPGTTSPLHLPSTLLPLRTGCAIPAYSFLRSTPAASQQPEHPTAFICVPRQILAGTP